MKAEVAVLTLVVATDERNHHDALQAAAVVTRESPCRVIAVIPRAARAASRLDTERSGETLVLRLWGPLRAHADSVVLPLLLPDNPVVAWWPGAAPDVPADDPLGRLAQRRLTDAAAVSRPLEALSLRARGYRPGDTDFAWTRLTGWRSLLASALDRPVDPVVSGVVAAARGNPSGVLLARWLSRRLDVPVDCRVSRGPGITEARLVTARGDVAVTRPDGRRAVLSRPGDPDRGVVLTRRATPELLAEELRRLDSDEPYAEALEKV